MLMKLTPGDDDGPLRFGPIVRPPEPKPEPVSDAVKWVADATRSDSFARPDFLCSDLVHPSAPKPATSGILGRREFGHGTIMASGSFGADHSKPNTTRGTAAFDMATRSPTPAIAPSAPLIVPWGASPEVTPVATQSMEYDIPGVGKVLVTGTTISSTRPAPTVSFTKVPGGLQYWISQPPAQVWGSWGDAPDDQYGA